METKIEQIAVNDYVSVIEQLQIEPVPRSGISQDNDLWNRGGADRLCDPVVPNEAAS